MADGSLLFDTKIDDSGFSSGLGKIAKDAAKGAKAVGAGLAVASGFALKVGMDFEAGMSQVAAISGATGKDLEALTAKAKELGSTTKFTATQAAEAMSNLASAGFETNEIIGASSGMISLAAASGEDLATSADIAASTLRGFGLEADKAGHVADVLAENANKTNAAVADTGEAMKYVAPIAHSLGISFEESAAAIGILANAGIKGGQAGTVLRGALTRLVNPTKEMTEVQEKLGITFFDSEGKMKSLSEIISTLRDATSGLTDQQKNQALATLFGQEALSGMLALIDAGPEQLQTLTSSYEQCDGAAQKMADTMNDNLKGKVTILQSALEGLGISAYEKFEGPMKSAVENVTKNVDKLNKNLSSGKLSKSMDKVATAIAKVAESAVNLAVKAIPVAIDGFVFLVDNGKSVATALIGIVAAYKTMTAIQKISIGLTKASAATQLAYEIAMKVLTGQMTLATAAQEAFNLAQMACPIGLLTGLVVGAVAAFTAFVAITAMSAEETDKNVVATDDLIKKHEELNETLKANEEARAQSIETAEQEAYHADVLAQRLETLADRTNKTKSEKEEMKNIVDQLNQMMPGLNLQYDEEADKLNQSTEALRQNIQAQKDMMMAKAYQENQAAILKDVADATMDLDEATKQHKDNVEALTKAEIDAEEKRRAMIAAGHSQNDGSEEAKAYNDATLALQKKSEAVQKSTEEVKKYKKQIKDLEKDYEDAGNKSQEFINKADISKQLSQIADQCREAGFEIPENLSDGIREGQIAIPASVDIMKSLVDAGMGDVLEKASEAGVTIPQNLAQGIADGSIAAEDAVSQVNELISFQESLDKAMEDGILLPENLAQGVTDGSVAVSDAVEQLKSLTTFDELADEAAEAGLAVPQFLSDGIKNGSIAPAEAVKQMQNLIDFQKMLNDSSIAGQKVPDNIMQAIANGSMKPKDAIKQMTDGMATEADASDKMGKSADKSTDGYSKKIESKAPEAKKSGKKLGDATVDGVKPAAGQMKTEGANAGQGFADGLSSKSGVVAGAAAALVRNAMAAAKKEQDSHSPSRKWRKEIGNMSGEGYVLGVEDKEKEAIQAGKNLVRSTIEAAKKEQSSNVLDWSFTNKPEAIRNLRMSAQTVNRSFVDSANTATLGNGSQQNNSQTVNYNMNLTVNGNGQMSPSEIAREMQNMAKRMEWEQ